MDRASDPATVALIRRPYVAEILSALDDRPRTLAGLRRITGAPYGLLLAAVRALAAYRAIRRDTVTGSWDSAAEPRLPFHLTPAGHELIDDLFRLDVWQAVYRQDARQ